MTPAWYSVRPHLKKKVCCHRPLVDISRTIAANFNTLVVRFDFRGEGESDMSFSESNVSTRLADLASITDYVSAEFSPRRILLGGVRAAFAFVMEFAQTRRDLTTLVAIDPILDTSSFAKDLLKLDLARQFVVHRRITTNRDQLAAQLRSGGTLTLDGYAFSSRFFLDLVDAERSRARLTPVLVPCLALTTNRGTAAHDLALLSECTSAIESHHLDMEPFWAARHFIGVDYGPVANIIGYWCAGRQGWDHAV